MPAYRLISMLAIFSGVLIAACAAPVAPTTVPTQPAGPTTAPMQPAAPTSVPTKPVAPGAQTPAGSTKLNMDEIFPPGPGREAMLDNCTTCHTFVPMVVLQMSQSLWDTNALGHRDRVPRMSDADYKAAYEYLAKNFNPDKPVPTLPQELLNFWTDY